MTDNIWTRHIPVLSTRHMPGPQALDGYEGAAEYECGWFLYVGSRDMAGANKAEPWVQRVREWLHRTAGPDAAWVSFDVDGEDLSPFLESYNW